MVSVTRPVFIPLPALAYGYNQQTQRAYGRPTGAVLYFAVARRSGALREIMSAAGGSYLGLEWVLTVR